MYKLVEYFKRAEKKKQTHSLGLEVEHFILNKETKRPMEYEDISKLLDHLSEFYPDKFYEEDRLIALESDEVLITLEPGCQLEVSLAYMSDLERIKSIYISTIKVINAYLDKVGYEIVYSGGLSSIDASNVTRIDKKRYELMETYFKTSGTRGHEMMKASAAVHVSIDYVDEADFIKKYRMANILHPIFAFLCSNTKYYAGKLNKDILLRDSIWANTDPARCGIIPSLFKKDFGYASYVEWLENIPLILMYDGKNFTSTNDKKLKKVASEYGWSDDYIAHYLSMSFLDIRLKRFIEIRSADSMPIDYTIAYCALIKGLFYKNDNLEKYSTLADSIGSILKIKDEIRRNDWNAEVFDKSISDFCLELLEDSKQGLNQNEWNDLKPLEKLVKNKTHVFKENNYEL